MALPACTSGGISTIQIPSADSSITGNVDAAQRTVRGSRALAASCSATPVVESGNCTNLEVAGTALGPTTPAASVPGLHPADLQSAYKLPSATAGSGQTIGVVVVGADANAESDLAVYRSTFGLPACSSASGCLTIVKGALASAADVNWGHEASIDLDMASASCPKCKLLLVEVATNSALNLELADAKAVSNGATVIDNSFAIPESTKEYSALWSHPGVPIVAAAGDAGYAAVSWPAAATNVIAVGATTLTRESASARGWSETPWSGTGSGCSAYAAKPVWQTDTGCSMRTVADLAAVGDPATPVAVYDTYLDSGWIQMGGTSVSAAIVAGVIGLAGNAATLTGAASLYAHASALFPVGAGSNGTCSPLYLCTTSSGYSGPVGLGTPNGIAAF